jgi:hypothetical protein
VIGWIGVGEKEQGTWPAKTVQSFRQTLQANAKNNDLKPQTANRLQNRPSKVKQGTKSKSKKKR